MDSASEKYGFELEEVDVKGETMNFIKSDSLFCGLVSQADGFNRVKKELDVVIEENEAAMVQLQHVAGINVDFDDLFSCKYLQVRFGLLPLNNVDKLKYYDGQPFILEKGFMMMHNILGVCI